MREIELKARVANKQALIEKLKTAGVALTEPKTQHDVVFCKPGQQDYEPGSVWLRIRTVDGLGTSIEAEKICPDNADYDTVVAELWEILTTLGITKADQEVLGYDVLLKRR